MKSIKHILDKSGFIVPESYFEDFKIKSLDADQQFDKSGFTVPKDYFANFKVDTPNSSKLIRLSELQKTIAVAATLLILLGTLLGGLLISPQAQNQLDFTKINRNEMMNYLEDEMMMDHDLYLESENLRLNYFNNSIKQNTSIIDDMDDISIEQLMDY